MGKKSKRKNKALQLRQQKPRKVRANEIFQFGPFKMARFGRFIQFENKISETEHLKYVQSLNEHYDEVCKEIDEIIEKTVKVTLKISPDSILKRAYWEMALNHLNIGSEFDVKHEGVLSLRMIDYVQSIIAATKPTGGYQYNDDMPDSLWHELKELVESLFNKLNIEYQICRTAHEKTNNPEYDPDFDEYYFKAQTYWANIRGDRFLIHEEPHIRELLSPHDSILRRCWGIGADAFVDELMKIAHSLSKGIHYTMEELDQFRTATLNKIDEVIKGDDVIANMGPPELMKKVVSDNNWEQWQDDIFDRFLGMGLFDLEKITSLPVKMLGDLSWEVGENTSFFMHGRYAGWPLRVWPIFQRPFICIEGHFYCFDLYSLFDNIYRVVQKIIIEKFPNYKEEWNKKQQLVSEQMPLKLLGKIFPNSKCYASVYYKWISSDSRKMNWYESDAVMVVGDSVIIVEVKAGAFSHSSPALDFDAYIESIKNLVMKPSIQGQRLLDYLNNSQVSYLYDSSHKIVAEIDMRFVSKIILVAVTLDPITEIAAQTQHLKRLQLAMGKYPVWSVSIDDLRIYSEIFANPLIFYHYLEQRLKAQECEQLKLNDELDHLGLYLKHNMYTEYVNELNLGDKTNWIGYRVEIEKYFSQKYADEVPANYICQKMPNLLRKTIDAIFRYCGYKGMKLACMLLDLSSEWRQKISGFIEESIKLHRNMQKAGSLSLIGNKMEITIFCFNKVLDEADKKYIEDHTRAVMLLCGEAVRWSLCLVVNAEAEICNAYIALQNMSLLSNNELARLWVIARQLRERRIIKTMDKSKKYGPNQPCPCGSGKKLKKCCGKI